MPAIELALLADLPTRHFTTGEVILTEDRPNTALYFLASGSVEIVRNNTQIDTENTPGIVLGEISTLLGLAPIATVRALAPSTVYIAGDPDTFLSANPSIILQIAKTLATRLQRASTFLSDLRKKNAADSDHLDMIHGVLECLLQEESSK